MMPIVGFYYLLVFGFEGFSVDFSQMPIKIDTRLVSV